MKIGGSWILVTIGILPGSTVVSAAPNDPVSGSNSSTTEKVCFLGPNAQLEEVLQESLKSCRRGDILDMSWLKSTRAMQLCDFNKVMLYHPTQGTVVACVYTGARRPVLKLATD